MEIKGLNLMTLTEGTQCMNFLIKRLESDIQVTELQRNDFYQLTLLTEGQLTQTIDFKRYKMTAHSASLVFPHQLQETEHSDNAKGLVVLFDETVFCSEILHNDLKDYNIDLQQKVNYISLENKPDTFGQLVYLWESIDGLYSQFNPINKMQIKLLIKTMILKLISLNPDKSLVSTNNEDSTVYIGFREKVDKEFKKNRIVKSYADQLHVTVKKLTAICRHFCGLTPLEIIHEKLNLELKKAMVDGQMNLKEIAFDFGFSSQAALNKYIEQKFSITPMQLRTRLKSKNDETHPIGPISHVGITVKDLDKSVAFYKDILRLTYKGEVIMQGDNTDALFNKPGTKVRVAYLNSSEELTAPPVELIQFTDSDIVESQSDLFKTSISEICFLTENADSIYNHLTSSGIECLSAPQEFDFGKAGFGKSKAFYFKDPDGIILEVMQPLH